MKQSELFNLLIISMESLQFIFSKKIVFIVVVVVVHIFGVMYIPRWQAASYIEEEYKNVMNNETIVLDNSLFHPEFVIYTQDNESTITAHFVRLDRKNLFFWKLAETSFQQMRATSGANGDEIGAELDGYLEAFQEGVASGDITSGNSVDLDTLQAAVDDTPTPAPSDEPMMHHEDATGENYIEVWEDGTLAYNGAVIDVITKNILSPTLSTDGKYIYYVKFTQTPEAEEYGLHPQYDDTIYQLDPLTNVETVLYDLGTNGPIDIAANSKYIVYTAATGATGVIDIATREKTEIHRFDIFEQTLVSPGDIIFINDFEAQIIPNDLEKMQNDNTRLFRLRFDTMTIEETAFSN
jgi:hypothetical protein